MNWIYDFIVTTPDFLPLAFLIMGHVLKSNENAAIVCVEMVG